jgi:hypothetical protein
VQMRCTARLAAIAAMGSAGHSPSQYATAIAVPAATNAKKANTNQARGERFFIFPTLNGR